MRIIVRDFKDLLREAFSAEENSKRSRNILREASETYTCWFDVTTIHHSETLADAKRELQQKLASSKVTVVKVKETANGDLEVQVRGTAEQVKAALKWGLRGSGERESDYFEEYAKKSR